MKKNDYCTIYLIRHGQSEGNIKGIVQGHIDENLTEEGVEQAKKAGEKFRGIKFEAIFSSDLIRAKHTAEIIKLERDLAVKTSKMLRERTFGDFEGMESKKFRDALKDELLKLENLAKEERWKYKAHKSIESDEEMMGRFITYLREIAVAYAGKNVLVATHGGPIRMMLIHLGWGSHGELPGGALKNTGYVVLESDGVDFFVKEIHGVEKHHNNRF